LSIACLLGGTPAAAQEGHPLKGSWIGTWGPNHNQSNDLLLVLTWDGKNITGTINPGTDNIPIKNATLNPEGWVVRFEADAKDIDEAGAFAVVLEAMAEPLAAKITKLVSIPTIGIGASPDCDGQILVMEDMLGLNPNPPRFVREYAHVGAEIEAAVKAYAADVRSRRFPGQENVYTMSKATKAV